MCLHNASHGSVALSCWKALDSTSLGTFPFQAKTASPGTLTLKHLEPGSSAQVVADLVAELGSTTAIARLDLMGLITGLALGVHLQDFGCVIGCVFQAVWNMTSDLSRGHSLGCYARALQFLQVPSASKGHIGKSFGDLWNLLP